MKAQPAPIGSRNFLGLAKERDEQQQHEISVHLRLELEIARERFAVDFPNARFKLQRGMQRMIDFLDEDDQRANVFAAQAMPRIVFLQLLDQPLRVVDADEKLV